MEPFDQGPAHHRNGQSDGHIDHRDLAPKDAGQQDQATQIHHGRGDQKRKRHAQRQSCAGKSDKKRDRRAGAKGGHRTQKGGRHICPQAVKAPQQPPAALRREVALDIRNHKNQQAQQQSDLDCVVQKELDAPAPAGGRVQSQGRHPPPDQHIQPLHPQDLFLYQPSCGL